MKSVWIFLLSALFFIFALEAHLLDEQVCKSYQQSNEQFSSEKSDFLGSSVTLRGILLLGKAKTHSKSDVQGIRGIQVYELDLPGSLQKLRKLLDPYFGKPLTSENISVIKTQLILHYRAQNRPVVHVQVPPQNIDGGVLQLVVYENKLDKVTVVGSRYYKDSLYINAISLKKGQPIEADILVNDLNWINRNPFHQTDAVLIPSEQTGYTNIELITQDRFPLRSYAGVDNTGIKQTGHTRWYTGFNWGNAFGVNHLFSYQFTMGTDYNKFWAHSGQYTALLPWHQVLILYGGYSEVNANLGDLLQGVRSEGNSTQGSLRYEIPLPSSIFLLEELIFGFDYKRTNTNLDFEGEFIFGNIVNITQLMAGFNAGLGMERIKNSMTMEIFYSPGNWLPNQGSKRYRKLRAGAKDAYVYGRGSVNSIFRLPSDFTFEPTVRLQLSSANLLASEQFGLGGYNTVRGYEEREVNGDNMLLINVELRTFSIPILKNFERLRNVKDELKFLVFLDYGYAKNHKLYFGEPDFQYLMGAGPGIRYIVYQFLTFRADWGFQLKDVDFGFNNRRHMFHFGLVLSC